MSGSHRLAASSVQALAGVPRGVDVLEGDVGGVRPLAEQDLVAGGRAFGAQHEGRQHTATEEREERYHHGDEAFYGIQKPLTDWLRAGGQPADFLSTPRTPLPSVTSRGGHDGTMGVSQPT